MTTPFRLDRRRLILAAAGIGPLAAAAQAPADHPSKPVRLIVPFPAGVSPDVVARQWADRFARLAGQPVVVENRFVESADFRALLHDYGLPPVDSRPADFARFLTEDAKKWARVVHDNRISVEG